MTRAAQAPPKGRARPAREPLRRVPAPVLAGAGILSVQVGAGVAARMFTTVSPAGLTGLRLWAATLLLAGLGGGPALRVLRGIAADRSWRDAALIAGFGVTLGIMNFSIYQAFARIPLGIAVTIEFLGPLGVAVASSRRLIDLLWVALAGAGVTVLGVAGAAVPGRGHHGELLTGVAFALVAATSWACYIVLTARVGKRFPGSAGLVVAMGMAALVITPAAVLSAGRALLRPQALAAGLAIGLLSSVIPYRFELEALRRVPARVFGIWMSLEPAVAALVGVVMLAQALSPAQWLAIGCVIIASAGAAFGAGPGGRPAAPEA
jgi:threonine/homoserine efflux transporter RhtA